MTPTYGSLFTGVGGFDLGFDQAGYQCKWQAEWDKHCQQTLAHHWPNTPRWSDVQDIHGADLPPVDIITYGSPCQDLSVAGKRAGIEGGRSSMFFQATRIIKEMRNATNGTFPRATIWENVPGALTSNNGDDFEVVLQTLADIGALEQEWHILDAQFFGIPQRRRRLFLISIFDPATANRPETQEILPVGEGRRRNTSTSRKTRQGTPTPTPHSTHQDGIVFHPHRSDGARIQHQTANTLTAFMGTGGLNVSMVAQPIPIQGTIIGRSDTAGPQGPGYGEEGDPMYTLDTVSQHGVAQPIPIQDGRDIEKHQNGLGIANEGDPMYTLDTTGAQSVAQTFVKVVRPASTEHPEIWRQEEISPTLNQFDVGDTRAVTIIVDQTPTEPPIYSFDTQFGSNANVFENQSPTLKATQASPSIMMSSVGDAVNFDEYNFTGGDDIHHAIRAGTKQSTGAVVADVGSPVLSLPNTIVRRLTPVECERLMGWPEDHTLFRADGRVNSDSTRYKMCGNGVASPVARWIAERLLCLFR